MTTLVRAFTEMTGDFARIKGPRAAAMRALASARMVAFPSLVRDMTAQRFLDAVARKRGIDGAPWDPFHCLSHPDYLVRGWSLEKRFRAALYHYRVESQAIDPALVERIYAPDGFTLWSSEVDGHAFSITLRLPPQDTVEGDLLLRLIADGRPIGNMCFVWADRAMFGDGPSRPAPFITRNQTHVHAELATFRACFKQNSPPYFLLAALAGIGLAFGMDEVYAIESTSQVSFEAQYESSFRNSYDEFWEKYNATRPVPEAFRLALPLQLRDLSELRSKHRSRAEQRRRAWGEVSQAATSALSGYWRGLPEMRAQPPSHDARTGPSGSAGSAGACCAAALMPQALELLRLPLQLV